MVCKECLVLIFIYLAPKQETNDHNMHNDSIDVWQHLYLLFLFLFLFLNFSYFNQHSNTCLQVGVCYKLFYNLPRMIVSFTMLSFIKLWCFNCLIVLLYMGVFTVLGDGMVFVTWTHGWNVTKTSPATSQSFTRYWQVRDMELGTSQLHLLM